MSQSRLCGLAGAMIGTKIMGVRGGCIMTTGIIESSV